MPRNKNRSGSDRNKHSDNNSQNSTQSRDQTDQMEDNVENTSFADYDDETTDCPHAKKYQPQTSKTSNKGIRSEFIVKSRKCLSCIQMQKENIQDNIDSEGMDLWFCMHCYESRCGRYSNGHGVEHYESDQSHCLSFQTTSWKIWCYKCDRFVAQKSIRGNLESTRQLAIDAFKKKKVKEKSAPIEIEMVEFPIEEATHQKFRVIGLSNLGNTCYFNSALQNLLYLTPFREQLRYTMSRSTYTLVPKKHPDLEPITFQYIDNEAAQPGTLTRALNTLIQETNIKSGNEQIKGKKNKFPTSSRSPRSVQNAISTRHRKFSNRSQQDSHELLRFLIDMIKDEEIKRLKIAFVDHFNVQDHKKNFKNYSDEKKKLLRKYTSEFKNIFVFTGTFIDDVFGGKLLSTVQCHSCNNVMDVDEDFLDFSLPLPYEKNDSSKLTKRNEKKMSKKAEKKRLKKGNSTTYSLQTFQNNSEKASKSDQNVDEQSVNASEDGDKIENVPDQICPESSQPNPNESSMNENKEQEKRLSSEMNGLNIESTEPQTKMIQENISNPSTENKGDNPEQVDAEMSKLNSLNQESNEKELGEVEDRTSSEELKTELQQDDKMETTDNTSSEITPEKIEDKVKSKPITRLRSEDNFKDGSLEYYLSRFFSPEKLYNDYICMHCNPQLLPKEESSTSNSDEEGKDEKENSDESIDLDQCHFSDVTKQFHIKSLPPILTIHLKRFTQRGFRLEKISKCIEFPMVLDMGPFCTTDTKVATDSNSQILYGLRGTVNHSGGMVAGHYIAHVNIADWNSQVKIDIPQQKSPLPIMNEETDLDTNDLPINPKSSDLSKCDNMDIDRVIEDQNVVQNVPDIEDNNMEVSTESACESPKQPQTPTILPTHFLNPYGHPCKHIDPTEDWYYISDSHVSKATSSQVFQSQAYILFYERLPLTPLK